MIYILLAKSWKVIPHVSSSSWKVARRHERKKSPETLYFDRKTHIFSYSNERASTQEYCNLHRRRRKEVSQRWGKRGGQEPLKSVGYANFSPLHPKNVSFAQSVTNCRTIYPPIMREKLFMPLHRSISSLKYVSY